MFTHATHEKQNPDFTVTPLDSVGKDQTLAVVKSTEEQQADSWTGVSVSQQSFPHFKNAYLFWRH